MTLASAACPSRSGWEQVQDADLAGAALVMRWTAAPEPGTILRTRGRTARAHAAERLRRQARARPDVDLPACGGVPEPGPWTRRPACANPAGSLSRAGCNAIAAPALQVWEPAGAPLSERAGVGRIRCGRVLGAGGVEAVARRARRCCSPTLWINRPPAGVGDAAGRGARPLPHGDTSCAGGAGAGRSTPPGTGSWPVRRPGRSAAGRGGAVAAAAPLPLAIRAGLHTGEVELDGDQVTRGRGAPGGKGDGPVAGRCWSVPRSASSWPEAAGVRRSGCAPAQGVTERLAAVRP